MQLDHLKRREFITLLGGALKFYGHTDGTFRGGPKRRSLTKKRCWEDSNDRQDRLRLAAHCSVSAKGRCAADATASMPPRSKAGSCSPNRGARTYGPQLSRETAGGNDDVIRGIISDGTPRMPGFKHYLGRAEIDAIIAYLKTVPTAATR